MPNMIRGKSFSKEKSLTLCVKVFCLHVHLCTTCMPGVWRDREGCRIAWNQSYRQLWATENLKLGLPREQQVLLTSEPSLQPCRSLCNGLSAISPTPAPVSINFNALFLGLSTNFGRYYNKILKGNYPKQRWKFQNPCNLFSFFKVEYWMHLFMNIYILLAEGWRSLVFYFWPWGPVVVWMKMTPKSLHIWILLQQLAKPEWPKNHRELPVPASKY